MDAEIDLMNIKRVQCSLSSQLKKSMNLSEDLTVKGLRLSQALKTTIVAICEFCDSFQKIADIACLTEGGSKEIATLMTRVNLKEKNIETSMKFLSNQIVSCMVNPLLTKIEDWKRFAGSSEKEYQKNIKDAKAKLKSLMGDSSKLSKKHKKSVSNPSKLQQIQTMNHRISLQSSHIRDIEICFLKSLMLEERARYCFLVNCFNPIFELQLKMFHEMSQMEELVFQLQQISKEPDKLIGEAYRHLNGFVGNSENIFDHINQNQSPLRVLNGSVVDGQSLSSNSSNELHPGRKTLIPRTEITTTDSGINLSTHNNKQNGIFDDGMSLIGINHDKSSILSANSSLSTASSSSRPPLVAYKSVSEYMAMVYQKRSNSDFNPPNHYDLSSTNQISLKNKQDFTLIRSRTESDNQQNVSNGESSEESEEEDGSSSSSSEENELLMLSHSPSCHAALKSVSRPHSPVATTLDRRATISGSAAIAAMRMIKSQTLGPNNRQVRPGMLRESMPPSITDEIDARSIFSEPEGKETRRRNPSRTSDAVLYPEQAIPLPSHYSNLNKLQTEARRKYSMVLPPDAEIQLPQDSRRTTNSDLAITDDELRHLQHRQQGKSLLGAPGKLLSEHVHYADRKVILLKQDSIQSQNNDTGEKQSLSDPFSAAIDCLDAMHSGSNAGSTGTIASNSTGSCFEYHGKQQVALTNNNAKGKWMDDDIFELPPPPPE